MNKTGEIERLKEQNRLLIEIVAESHYGIENVKGSFYTDSYGEEEHVCDGCLCPWPCKTAIALGLHEETNDDRESQGDNDE